MHFLSTIWPTKFRCSDGAEAWITFTAGGPLRRPVGSPVVILLDLKLPKLDGVQVLRQLKSDEQMRFVPVVVLTSLAKRATWRSATHSEQTLTS